MQELFLLAANADLSHARIWHSIHHRAHVTRQSIHCTHKWITIYTTAALTEYLTSM